MFFVIHVKQHLQSGSICQLVIQKVAVGAGNKKISGG